MIPSTSNSKGKVSKMLPLMHYKNTRRLVENLFEEPIKRVLMAGMLRFFLSNWQKITGDPAILETVTGYSVDFLENPYQTRKSGTRNQRLIGKECHSGSYFSKEPVCQLSILVAEKRWWSEASYKSEGIKPSPQHGRIMSIEGHFKRRGLSFQARPQRCLFLCT